METDKLKILQIIPAQEGWFLFKENQYPERIICWALVESANDEDTYVTGVIMSPDEHGFTVRELEDRNKNIAVAHIEDWERDPFFSIKSL